jgi:hypothetical protein
MSFKVDTLVNVLPHLPAVLITIGIELARGETGDDRALADGG